MSKFIRDNRVTLGVIIAGACAFGAPAYAHGFGQRYDLPLPLSLYLVGAGAAVVASFVIVGLLARPLPGARGYPRIDLLAHPLGRLIAHPVLSGFLKLVSVGLFILTVIAGFCGSQDPYQNIAPTLVWIIWWVGLAVFSAFVGDLWALVNPWRAIFDWTERLYRTVTGRDLVLRWPYPEVLGVWPAVALLLVLSWVQLGFPSPAVPATNALLAVPFPPVPGAGRARV